MNDAFVLRYMNGEDPIGRLVKEGGAEGSARLVVGRVADARYFRDLRREPPPTLYLPQSQLPALGSSVVVRVRVPSGNPLALERALASALEQAGQPVTVRVRPLEQYVRGALVQERLVATVGGFFAALALLIAGVGLYGVTACSVSRRRAELGIRLTLGATPTGIVSLVFTRVALLVGLGVMAGTALALWLATFVRALLHDLEPSDPGTLAGAAAVLVVTGVLAALIPAWRAARTDPATVLRES